MEKKTIQVDSNIPKSLLIGFALAFVTVFAVQHFSTFSYIPNLSNPTIDYGHKVVISGTYDTRTTPVGALYQTTPFGTKIDLPTNGMMCSELLYDSEFKSYSNKGVLYAKSVFTDYKYLLLFWLAYTLIVLFFKRYRLKVLILILPMLGMSCDKTKQEPIATPKTAIDTAKTTLNNPNTPILQNTPGTAVKHSFVVFKVKDKYFGKESVIVTGIFNTPYTISTDEEYMILDDTQAKCNAYLFDKNILERYMMRFDSYAEASQEKERISKIRNTTVSNNQTSTPKTLTKEEQKQIIREWKSITPEEHEQARQLQMEHEMWVEEQKKTIKTIINIKISIMKKLSFKSTLVALSLTLATINCSNNNDDDNTPTNQQPATTQYFHPPTWIQGTWGVTNGTTSNQLYKFTADDFILLVTGVSEQSMTGTIKSSPNGGSVLETVNNGTQYNFTVKYNITTTTQSFEFRKVSATHIQWKDNSNGTWFDLVKM